MTVFRWIMFVLALLSGTATVVAFGIFIGADIDAWGDRAKVCRRWFYAISLLWFNVEIWGRVVLIIAHW